MLAMSATITLVSCKNTNVGADIKPLLNSAISIPSCEGSWLNFEKNTKITDAPINRQMTYENKHIDIGKPYLCKDKQFSFSKLLLITQSTLKRRSSDTCKKYKCTM